ncbi:hypothetical protein K2173_027473 [Erythroxylum novogranatense]|uniref:Uncharacterized protein n=1 Tax=Erythroxylum novogranatense TaxID=1862640 RepID=A0AAV8TZ76_9ROSI|nr:hypothetical protein K2173_027473 [Erythroxylum novogranatense]
MTSLLGSLVQLSVRSFTIFQPTQISFPANCVPCTLETASSSPQLEYRVPVSRYGLVLTIMGFQEVVQMTSFPGKMNRNFQATVQWSLPRRGRRTTTLIASLQTTHNSDSLTSPYDCCTLASALIPG